MDHKRSLDRITAAMKEEEGEGEDVELSPTSPRVPIMKDSINLEMQRVSTSSCYFITPLHPTHHSLISIELLLIYALQVPLVEKSDDYVCTILLFLLSTFSCTHVPLQDPEKAELSPSKVSFFRMLKIARGEIGSLVWGTFCLIISAGSQMAV